MGELWSKAPSLAYTMARGVRRLLSFDFMRTNQLSSARPPTAQSPQLSPVSMEISTSNKDHRDLLAASPVLGRREPTLSSCARGVHELFCTRTNKRHSPHPTVWERQGLSSERSLSLCPSQTSASENDNMTLTLSTTYTAPMARKNGFRDCMAPRQRWTRPQGTDPLIPWGNP